MIILQDQMIAWSVLICNGSYSECQTKLVLKSKSDTQRDGRRKKKSETGKKEKSLSVNLSSWCCWNEGTALVLRVSQKVSSWLGYRFSFRTFSAVWDSCPGFCKQGLREGTEIFREVNSGGFMQGKKPEIKKWLILFIVYGFGEWGWRTRTSRH